MPSQTTEAMTEAPATGPIRRPVSKAFAVLLWSIRVLAVVAILASGYLLLTTLDPSQKLAGCGGAERRLHSGACQPLVAVVRCAGQRPGRGGLLRNFLGDLADSSSLGSGAATNWLGSFGGPGGDGRRRGAVVHWLANLGDRQHMSLLPDGAWMRAADRPLVGGRVVHRAAIGSLETAFGLDLCGALLAASCLVGTLVGGQQLSSEPAHARYELELGGHVFDFDPHDFPTLGPSDAPHWLMLLGDFTCPHCQKTNPLILEAIRRYHGQLAVISVPVPMSTIAIRGSK